jgi:hypothetical protein
MRATLGSSPATPGGLTVSFTTRRLKRSNWRAPSRASCSIQSTRGKGLAGLIALVQAGRWQLSDNGVFLHTGGAPALFAYRSALSI